MPVPLSSVTEVLMRLKDAHHRTARLCFCVGPFDQRHQSFEKCLAMQFFSLSYEIERCGQLEAAAKFAIVVHCSSPKSSAQTIFKPLSL